MEKIAFNSMRAHCPDFTPTYCRAVNGVPFLFQLSSYARHCSSFATSWPLVPRSYPIVSHFPLRKPLASISCAADGSVPEVAVDPTLKVKKRALDISDDLRGTSIFLFGLQCSLKYRVGKVLADAIGYYYFDSDDILEEAAGGPEAAKSLRENDEKSFRETETEVIKQLSYLGRLVVCVGNKAVESKTNLTSMRDGISLWIDVPLEMVAREMIGDQNQLTTSGSFEEVLAQVTDLYNGLRGGFSTADAKISLQSVASRLDYDSIDSVTGEDVAMEALNQFDKLTRVKKMMEAAGTPF